LNQDHKPFFEHGLALKAPAFLHSRLDLGVPFSLRKALHRRMLSDALEGDDLLSVKRSVLRYFDVVKEVLEWFLRPQDIEYKGPPSRIIFRKVYKSNGTYEIWSDVYRLEDMQNGVIACAQGGSQFRIKLTARPRR
jgi:hypothetical protein